MTLREIAKLGHPVLITPAEVVAEPDRPEIQGLIDDMIETMIDAKGIGLAAPQVHEGVRLIVALEIADRSERGGTAAMVLVNPVLEPIGAELDLAFEGCLSIPHLRGLVPRHRRIGYRGLDRHGRPVAGEAQGLLARVLQHEVDHLDGILYPMRVSDLRHLAFEEEIPHLETWIASQGERG